MTDAQKLEALVRRAVEGGFDFDSLKEGREFYTFYEGNLPVREIILFNHDFARALFGEDTFTYYIEDWQGFPGKDSRDDGPREVAFWEYHLQQAVISKDPTGYMYQAVFGGKND